MNIIKAFMSGWFIYIIEIILFTRSDSLFLVDTKETELLRPFAVMRGHMTNSSKMVMSANDFQAKTSTLLCETFLL